ncbi:MAG: hypothetical protein ABUJ98_14560, partial [Hyphomicrobium sp.]
MSKPDLVALIREQHYEVSGNQCVIYECGSDWPCPPASAAEELADIRDGERKILEEKCAGDEKHCGCVPTLRKEVERL